MTVCGTVDGKHPAVKKSETLNLMKSLLTIALISLTTLTHGAIFQFKSGAGALAQATLRNQNTWVVTTSTARDRFSGWIAGAENTCVTYFHPTTDTITQGIKTMKWTNLSSPALLLSISALFGMAAFSMANSVAQIAAARRTQVIQN